MSTITFYHLTWTLSISCDKIKIFVLGTWIGHYWGHMCFTNTSCFFLKIKISHFKIIDIRAFYFALEHFLWQVLCPGIKIFVLVTLAIFGRVFVFHKHILLFFIDAHSSSLKCVFDKKKKMKRPRCLRLHSHVRWIF